MSIFDTAPAKTGDTFVRHNPNYLTMFYGTDQVTPFWVADMDLPIADRIKDALRYIADRGQSAYEFNSDGIFATISGWFARRHNLTLNPKNFVPFPGVLAAISLLIRELSDTGDRVLMQVPAYYQFGKIITLPGARIFRRHCSSSRPPYRHDGQDLRYHYNRRRVETVSRAKEGFTMHTDQGPYTARAVISATGSAQNPLSPITTGMTPLKACKSILPTTAILRLCRASRGHCRSGQFSRTDPFRSFA